MRIDDTPLVLLSFPITIGSPVLLPVTWPLDRLQSTKYVTDVGPQRPNPFLNASLPVKILMWENVSSVQTSHHGHGGLGDHCMCSGV